MDKAVDLLREGGFRKVRFRGDSDFSLTRHFDQWDQDGVEFVFGIDAHKSFVEKAEELPESAWKRLRRKKRKIKTKPRIRPENVKRQIVEERGYRNFVLDAEEITEIPYTPVRAKGKYRMIILRKTIGVEEGQWRLFEQYRYFFYVTNAKKKVLSTRGVVFEANARCNQENVIAQMKHGVHAMRMPSDGLLSNWAYLVIAGLAWNLKAWLSISLAKLEGAEEIRRMEFRRFLRSLMLIPCQVVNGARGLVLRILIHTPWAKMLVDGMEHFRRRRRAPALA